MKEKDIDKHAFPYQPPTKLIREKYANFFSHPEVVTTPICKRCFDILFSSFVLVPGIAILLALKLFLLFESLVKPSSRGPLLYFYWGVSQGERFKKWKIRIIQTSRIDQNLALNNEWAAYKNEWDPKARTWTGAIAKKFYLDEIPQFISVLKGDMSFVGPRPLSVEHFEKDAEQGNITRKMLKGGVLGLGHIHKGTARMGDPEFEYEYLQIINEGRCKTILATDFMIIFKGLRLVAKGQGL